MAAAGDICKLILLGNGSVGKSSIIARFVDDGFQRVYKQTTGVDFFEKLLNLRGDKSVKLQVWDIGGQSVGSAMLSKYIFGSNIVMLCYDVTDPRSFNDCEDWLMMTRRTLAQSGAAAQKAAKLFLVGNKIDLQHLRKVTEEQHARFIEEERLDGGCFVSAQSGENVLREFYKVAGEHAGVQLTAQELACHDRVLNASVVHDEGGEDEMMTDEMKRIMEEDEAAGKALREKLANGGRMSTRKKKKKGCAVS